MQQFIFIISSQTLNRLRFSATRTRNFIQPLLNEYECTKGLILLLLQLFVRFFMRYTGVLMWNFKDVPKIRKRRLLFFYKTK